MTREPFDEGDLDVYHPICRTRILITRMETRRGRENRQPTLYVEGICQTCDCYVYLQQAFPTGVLGDGDGDGEVHGQQRSAHHP